MGKHGELIGMRFNDLTVEEYTDQVRNGRKLYKCKCCICGREKFTDSSELRSGRVRNCGKHPKDIKILIGKKYGKLTVLKVADKRHKNGRVMWECVCECGKHIDVLPGNLKTGMTISCGCFRKEKVKSNHRDGTMPGILKESEHPRSTNTSGVTGVYFNKARGVWVAEIMFKKERIIIGRYTDFKDAVQARKEKEEEIFGKYLKKLEEKKDDDDKRD